MNVLPQRFIDKRLIVSAPARSTSPRNQPGMSPSSRMVILSFVLGTATTGPRFPLLRVIFSLHKFSLYTLRSRGVASRAEINRIFSARHE
jgi:hypothetical protein